MPIYWLGSIRFELRIRSQAKALLITVANLSSDVRSPIGAIRIQSF